MHWSAAYVGLPWAEKGTSREGIACWGLCALVLAEQRGIEVPRYEEAITCSAEREEIAALFDSAPREWPWSTVEIEREFDIVVFRRLGMDVHAGIVVEPGRMLHVTSGQESCIASYRDGKWAPRLSGRYRHAGLGSDPHVA